MSPQASQTDPWDSLLSCNTMDARSAAITYATLGMKVIRVHGVDAAGHCTCGAYPCGGEANGNAGKHPVDTGWTTAATSDPATVASLFPPDSRWNVGIVPGPSGLSVLDLDVKRANANGVNFFEGSHEHVGGPAAITPSGGAHRIFRHTTACPPSMSKKTLGFDWMTNSGMIVVAPSVTPKGRYRWTAGGPPRPAPAAVIAKLILYPTGELSNVPLALRLIAVSAGFAAFLIGGKRTWIGIVTALGLLIGGQLLLG